MVPLGFDEVEFLKDTSRLRDLGFWKVVNSRHNRVEQLSYPLVKGVGKIGRKLPFVVITFVEETYE